jgi:hypothetical protein
VKQKTTLCTNLRTKKKHQKVLKLINRLDHQFTTADIIYMPNQSIFMNLGSPPDVALSIIPNSGIEMAISSPIK